MVRQCYVPGCSNRGVGVKFFCVPFTNKQRFESWVSACPFLLKFSLRQLENVRICISHFNPHFITDKNRLTSDAIPTLKLPSSNPCQMTVPKLFTPEEIKSCRPSSAIILYKGGDGSGVSCPAASNERHAVRTHADKSANEDNVSDGIDSNYVNDPEDEASKRIFSWQKEETLHLTEDTDVLCLKEGDAVQLPREMGDVSLYEDSPPGAPHGPNPGDYKHAEYRCNICQKEIIGFRYACVQCSDWDLCGACEGSAAHATHYVLRVPGPRPYNEIQTVLAAIRQQLLSENLFLPEQMREDRVKSEPEDEAPRAARDPLLPPRAPDRDTDGSEWSPPRRKRRRRKRRSSDADDSSDSDTVSNDTSVRSGSDALFYKPDLFNSWQPDRLTLNKGNTTNTRRKPVTRSESNHPILEIDTDSLEQINSRIQEHPGGNVLEIPHTIREEEVTVTIYREEMPSLNAFSINRLEKGDGDLKWSDQH